MANNLTGTVAGRGQQRHHDVADRRRQVVGAGLADDHSIADVPLHRPAGFAVGAAPWGQAVGTMADTVQGHAPSASGEPGASLFVAGTYSFEMNGTSTNLKQYSSREGANPPQLVIVTKANVDKFRAMFK